MADTTLKFKTSIFYKDSLMNISHKTKKLINELTTFLLGEIKGCVNKYIGVGVSKVKNHPKANIVKNEIKQVIFTFKEMSYVISLFLGVIFLIIPFSIAYAVYDDGFANSLLGNLNASLWEFFVLGIVLFFFEKKKQNEESVADLKNDLENHGDHSTPSFNLARLKIIKTLNSKGIYEINTEQMKLDNMSAIKSLTFIDSQLSGLSFFNSKIQNSKFINCNIEKLCLKKSNLVNVTFTKCKLRGINISEAILRQVKFIDCEFDRGFFNDADLQSCTLKNCSLKNVSFKDANLRNTNMLQSYNIDVTQLSKARILKYIKCDANIMTELKLLVSEEELGKQQRR